MKRFLVGLAVCALVQITGMKSAFGLEFECYVEGSNYVNIDYRTVPTATVVINPSFTGGALQLNLSPPSSGNSYPGYQIKEGNIRFTQANLEKLIREWAVYACQTYRSWGLFWLDCSAPSVECEY